MKITKRELRRIIRETVYKNRGRINEKSTTGEKVKKGLKGLFGWMPDPDWEKEIERIETAENIKTIGDLKFVLDMAKLAKKNEKAADAWGKFGTGFFVDLLGGGTMKGLTDVVTDTLDAPDEETGGIALDYLNVDDGVSKIVDDRIENAFLKDLKADIMDEPPETELKDFDATKKLAQFIATNVDDRTITGWEGQQEGRKMRISKRHLRRIIKEAVSGLMSEGTLYVTKTDYGGWNIEDEKGEWIGVGEMVKSLLDAGIHDFTSEEHINTMLQRDAEGVQGGLQRWDSDVFYDYYGVDMDMLIQLYAKQNGMQVEEVGDEDEDDGTGAFEEYYS